MYRNVQVEWSRVSISGGQLLVGGGDGGFARGRCRGGGSCGFCGKVGFGFGHLGPSGERSARAAPTEVLAKCIQI